MGIKKSNKDYFLIGAISALALTIGVVATEEIIRKRKTKKYRLMESLQEYAMCPYEIESNIACSTTKTSECGESVCGDYDGAYSEISDNISCEE